MGKESLKQPVDKPTPIAPILRWAGSKRSLLPALLSHLPSRIGRYFEPFAGSASLFFALCPAHATLSDLNDELIQAYEQVQDSPEAIAATVNGWPRDKPSYLKIRSKHPQSLPPLERAARFIYLNRLCFNGIYRTNRRGAFNVPYGSRVGAMPSAEHFLECATVLRGADLVSADFETATASASEGDFIYLDPPYSQAISDNYGVYGYDSFQATDLHRLVTCMNRLDALGANVLVSYRATDALTSLPPPWLIQHVTVRSQVGGRLSSRSTRSELLIANFPPPTISTQAR